METGLMEKNKVSRSEILDFENKLSQTPGAVLGDSDQFPLKHSFAEGVYVREIFIPKGSFLTGKIHRHAHPNFLMSGEVLVVTEDGGREHLKAPLSMISKAGTKRAIYAVEDTVWITVHVTNETDLAKIEDYVIAKTYDDLLPLEKLKINSELDIANKNCLILALKEKGRDFAPLLTVKPSGLYLPFREALEKLKEANISIDGLFVVNKGLGMWHVTVKDGMPLSKFEALESDLVGTWVGAGIAGSGIAGSLISTFGKNGSVDQKPMITDAQAGAQNALLAFGRSGKTPWGYDFTKGYDGSLGSYDMTGLEKQGQGVLASTLSTGNPFIFTQGTNALNDILSTNNYDPNNDGGVYSGLSKTIDFNRDEAIKASKQASAYTGNLYSTSAGRNLDNINVQAGNQKSGILANLYQNFVNQKIGAANSAISAGGQDQNMSLARIAASQQYGALQRTLQDSQAKDAYSAWLTQRSSELAPMQSLTSLGGMSANYGVQSVPTPNPWNSLLNTLTSTGGYLYGLNASGGSMPAASPTSATPAPVAGATSNPWMNQYLYPGQMSSSTAGVAGVRS